MKRMVCLWVVSMMTVVLFTGAAAQSNSGVISGEVILEDGSSIPGVTVALTGAALAGKKRAVTNEKGVYRFMALPPGEYETTYELEGFKTVKHKGVKLKAGQTVKLYTVMQVANLTQELVVCGKAPTIDVRKSSSSVTYGGNRLPTGRNPWAGRSKRPKRPQKAQCVPPSYRPPANYQQTVVSPRVIDHNTEEYDNFYDNRFKQTVREPLSTFSIDVDTASYSNIRRFINNRQLPQKDAVRIEEMINYFHYDYPQPKGEVPFSILTEISTCPWNTAHRLIHIGLQGKKMNQEKRPANNLVFLLDVSGSMGSYNKLPLLKTAFKLLVKQLDDKDRVAVVVYAGAAGLVLPSTPGYRKDVILDALDRLRSGGSTAGCAGIQLAYKTAREHFIQDGNNRIILATDGDFNVGVSNTTELVKMIEEKRKSGIFLTVLGFGMGNYKDEKVEKLADKGNGNYFYIDNLMEAKKVFVEEMNGTLFTIAKDVKIQVEFNPVKVGAYRLIGYVNRKLKNEDFKDDKKDAGELGAGHRVTALYEVIPAGSRETVPGSIRLKYQAAGVRSEAAATDEVMTVKLRYKPPKEKRSRLIVRAINDSNLSLERTGDNFRHAAAVAQFGLLLRDSEYKSKASYDNVLKLARGAKGGDHYGYRAEFIKLVETCQILHQTNLAQANPK